MDSSAVFIENLKRYYKVNSLRTLAGKMDYSISVVLNWSSGRSSPSIQQLNDIAYHLGIEVSELLVKNNSFSIETRIWRDHIDMTLVKNLEKLRLEKGIHESFFNDDIFGEYNMSYRSFLRYVNGKNKRVNLNVLDRLSEIFKVEVSSLLESEKK